MKAASTAAVLVLSASPLTDAKRTALTQESAGCEFLDLPWLRRQGPITLIKHLRRVRADRVLIVGEPSELSAAGYALKLLAMLVPARELLYRPAGEPAHRFSRWEAAAILFAISGAFAAAMLALPLNVVDVLRLKLRSQPDKIQRRALKRCLYLKPFLTFTPVVGGSTAHTVGVLNALARCDQDVHVVQMFPHRTVDPRVSQFAVPSRCFSIPYELAVHLQSRHFRRHAFAQHRCFRPDYIYQRYSLNDLSAVMLRRRYGIPLVTEFNGSEVWTQRHWGRKLAFEPLSRWIEEINLRESDLVVVVSDEMIEQVLRAGVSRARILSHPNCVDSARFSAVDTTEVRRKLGVPTDSLLCTFVGTFGLWHGATVLAQAIDNLSKTAPELLNSNRVHFCFVGDGPQAPIVRSIVNASPGASYVTIAGLKPETEIPEILLASDVLVSPHVPNPDGTRFFGSPTKLFEYMAAGKTIVASDLEQIGQVLRGWHPGTTAVPLNRAAAAILVRPGDAESLCSGLKQAVQMDPGQRRMLGEKARILAQTYFTWDRYCELVINTLGGITADNACRTAA